jgi:hypothetical protein
LRYDSTSGAEKSAIVVQKGNSNKWKEVLVNVGDVAFQNRQEGGSDVSLYNMGDDDDTFHMVEVGHFGTISTTSTEPEDGGQGEPTEPVAPEEDPSEVLPPEEAPSEQEMPYNNNLHLPSIER